VPNRSLMANCIAREVAGYEQAWDVVNQRPTTWIYPGYLALYMLASVGLDWLSGVGSTRWTQPLVGGTVVIILLAVFMLLHGYIDMWRRLDTTAELLRLQE